MEEILIDREYIRSIFMRVKPYFKEKLGRYTHQRISGDWHFHGLGFVNGDMTYVFGINIGFFKITTHSGYSHIGMNVLVRTNGIKSDLRQKYCDFFRKNLNDWIIGEEQSYTSDRGGVGSAFPRYKAINELETDEDIIQFLKSCIDGIYEIYPEVSKNPDNLFDNVLRAAPPWNDRFVDIARNHLQNS